MPISSALASAAFLSPLLFDSLPVRSFYKMPHLVLAFFGWTYFVVYVRLPFCSFELRDLLKIDRKQVDFCYHMGFSWR
jgi:hypothetical protein